MVFKPGRDRERSYLLELKMTIPSGGKCVVRVDFDRALLKWTEYPPDANHGFYVPSAVIRATLPSATNISSSWAFVSHYPSSSSSAAEDNGENQFVHGAG
jgi:phosphatidylinositol glycan class T